MKTKILEVSTTRRSEMVDITQQVQSLVTQAAIKSGVCVVFVPHTTAGITINEHADPDVIVDSIRHFDGMVPWSAQYQHAEGNAAAHIKASLMGSSVTIIIEQGLLKLGTWQGVFFTEFDGPRQRTAWVQFISEKA